MKTYRYVELGTEEEPYFITMSEQEIIDTYWSYWLAAMMRAFPDGSELITRENCIDDYVAVHWATEITNGNEPKATS